jgi:predicted permease
MAASAKRDLNELAHHPDYNVKVQMERRETDSNAQHRRLKDLISFVAVLVALGLLMVAALAVVLVPGLAPESKNWATSALSAIVAGAVGYLGGKKHSD